MGNWSEISNRLSSESRIRLEPSRLLALTGVIITCESTPWFLPSSAMSSRSRASVAPPLLGLPAKYNSVALVLIASVLLLRTRLTSGAIPALARGPKLSKEELAQVEQQLYVDVADGSGSKELLVPFRGRVSKVKPIFPARALRLQNCR
jgi:hypothetical protein